MAITNIATLGWIGEIGHMKDDFGRIIATAGIDWKGDVPHERKRDTQQIDDHERVQAEFYRELEGRAFRLIEWDVALYETARQFAEQKRRNC